MLINYFIRSLLDGSNHHELPRAIVIVISSIGRGPWPTKKCSLFI